MPAVIVSSSVLCAAGRGTEQLWASVRAGIARIRGAQVMDQDRSPLQMGLVPEDALPPELPPELDSLPLPSRARRMLRLGAPTLKAVLEDAGAPPLRLYLGLPELAVAEAPWLKGFALYLGRMAGAAIDAPNSRVIPAGRAASLSALDLALEALERDPSQRIIVGAVDTHLDPKLLATLCSDRRLLGPRTMDGFVPGEGAAFLVLAHPSTSTTKGPAPPIMVQAAATATDPGHRDGTEPARGEGLAQAIDVLRSRLANGSVPVATTFAGLNGEGFNAKLWGVARLRHSDFFAPTMKLEHPADCFGDVGAATGAILLGLAATALSARHRAGPALVWAASDGESRACALLSASES